MTLVDTGLGRSDRKILNHIARLGYSAGILFIGDSLVSRAGELRPSRGVNTCDQALALRLVQVQAGLGAQIVCAGHGPLVRDAPGKFPAVGGE